MDLSKGFYCILFILEKLKFYGVSGPFVNVVILPQQIESMCMNQSKGLSSLEANVMTGVLPPRNQCYVLGPFFFTTITKLMIFQHI